MPPRLYWADTPELSGRLCITRRPRGGGHLRADVASWRDCGIDVVVSLLEADEAERLDLGGEGRACVSLGLAWVSFPVADFAVPALIEAAAATIDALARQMAAGRSLAFHCYASRGRSPTLAACVLVRRGLSADDAVARLSAARGHAIPETVEQRRWIADYARSIG